MAISTTTAPAANARKSNLGLYLLLRVVATWVDFSVLFLFLVVAEYLLGNELYQATIVIWLGALILYFPVGEGFWGRTCGKLVTGLIVVDEAGQPPGVLKATLRAVLRLIEVIWVPLVSVIVMACSENRRRLGDMIARTYVLRTRELAGLKLEIGVKPPVNRTLSNTLTLIAIGAAIIGMKIALNTWPPSPSEGEHAQYHLRVLANGRAVLLSGTMSEGTADALQILLDAAPATRILYLNSPGGSVNEGLKIHDLIRDRNLATYTFTDCSSACTLAFLGGRPRYLEKGAKLGFHSAHFGERLSNRPPGINNQQKHILELHGVPAEFVHKALSTPPDSMWYPTLDELIRAGIVDLIADPNQTKLTLSKAQVAPGEGGY